MATIERLKKRPDFLAAAEGRRFHTERMTAQGRLRNPDVCPSLRLGFTITKRVGHATERNRIRRRLRAALGLVAADLPSELAGLPADIVLIARRPALEAPFEVLAEDLRRAIPAVTRPAAPRGDRPSSRSGGRRSRPIADTTTSQTSSPARSRPRLRAGGPDRWCRHRPVAGVRQRSPNHRRAQVLRGRRRSCCHSERAGGVPDGQ
ncbi:ribonuclease P protein component [Methylobacterium sp. NMS12]|uniref:ribonuclease P protein component n=1 Tax=Methylobacterium sp. NMS12 TaxID=3079766 RepID=UPI003F884533